MHCLGVPSRLNWVLKAQVSRVGQSTLRRTGLLGLTHAPLTLALCHLLRLLRWLGSSWEDELLLVLVFHRVESRADGVGHVRCRAA